MSDIRSQTTSIESEKQTPFPGSRPGMPLFEQLKAELREDILNMRLKPGEKLPSESRLQTQYGVSRITVRQALSTLQAEGLIETFNGKGSFVTRPANAPRLGMMTGFFDYMRTRGKHAHGKTLSIRKSKASKLVSEALHLPPNMILTTITTLRLVENVPIVMGRLIMEQELYERLMRFDIENEDIMEMLESRLDFRLESTHIEASAIKAGKERAKLLETDVDSPLLLMRFVPHDISNKPLLFSEMYFRPEKFSYKAIIGR